MVMHSVTSVCLFVLHFWHECTSSEYVGQGGVSRSVGQGQGHSSKNQISSKCN